MAYPTPNQIAAKAAEKGFRVGAYVHMSTRTAETAAPIREFSSINGQVQVVWMDGACRNLLGELRLSSQHRLRYQFPPGYDFFLTPQLVAEASRQAGSNGATESYTAAWVKGYGSADTDTWVTTDANPQAERAVFVSLRQQPATVVVPDISPSMELLIGGQRISAADVGHWMNAGPRQGAELFKTMQQLYGPQPTMLHLTLFSGATMLAPVAASVVAARDEAKRNKQ